eukprot:SAG31_NODE_1539_length_7970_cov_5.655571_1_plen_285_part_00
MAGQKRHRYVPMPSTLQGRKEQAEIIARHGVRNCRRMLRNNDDCTLKVIAANESFDAVRWTEIGVMHDIRSWISLYLAVAAAEKHLVPELETGAGDDGFLGRFETTLGIWADATDGTGKTKHVSQAALVLIDKHQKLFKDGKSMAMMWSCWMDHEDWFISLLESELPLQSVSGQERPLTVTFPWWKTATGIPHHIDIDFSYRDLVFIADNKAFGAFRGKVQGSGRCRLHMLQPLPIELCDCVGLYQAATVVDNIIWRVETLHMALITATSFVNCPARNRFFTNA